MSILPPEPHNCRTVCLPRGNLASSGSRASEREEVNVIKTHMGFGGRTERNNQPILSLSSHEQSCNKLIAQPQLYMKTFLGIIEFTTFHFSISIFVACLRALEKPTPYSGPGRLAVQIYRPPIPIHAGHLLCSVSAISLPPFITRRLFLLLHHESALLPFLKTALRRNHFCLEACTCPNAIKDTLAIAAAPSQQVCLTATSAVSPLFVIRRFTGLLGVA